MKVKKFLNNVMQAELTPIRERRKEWEARIPDVYDILKAGSAVAEKKAAETMTAVKKPCRSITWLIFQMKQLHPVIMTGCFFIL